MIEIRELSGDLQAIRVSLVDLCEKWNNQVKELQSMSEAIGKKLNTSERMRTLQAMYGAMEDYYLRLAEIKQRLDVFEVSQCELRALIHENMIPRINDLIRQQWHLTDREKDDLLLPIAKSMSPNLDIGGIGIGMRDDDDDSTATAGNGGAEADAEAVAGVRSGAAGSLSLSASGSVNGSGSHSHSHSHSHSYSQSISQNGQHIRVTRKLLFPPLLGFAVDDDLFVIKVEEESQAYLAGVKKGWIVRSINDIDDLETMRKMLDAPPDSFKPWNIRFEITLLIKTPRLPRDL